MIIGFHPNWRNEWITQLVVWKAFIESLVLWTEGLSQAWRIHYFDMSNLPSLVHTIHKRTYRLDRILKIIMKNKGIFNYVFNNTTLFLYRAFNYQNQSMWFSNNVILRNRPSLLEYKACLMRNQYGVMKSLYNQSQSFKSHVGLLRKIKLGHTWPWTLLFIIQKRGVFSSSYLAQACSAFLAPCLIILSRSQHINRI